MEQSHLNEEAAVDCLTALAMISESDEEFDYSLTFITCRRAGLESLLKAETTVPDEQMGEIGHHLRNTVRLVDYLFIGTIGSTSPLANVQSLPVADIGTLKVWKEMKILKK